ncbi:MAG: cation:proton antiporter regulatory subunit [Acidimicrobiales bacterium]
MSDVSEQDLPGIGRRYDLTTQDGERVSVVIHHSGRRDLYAFAGDDAATVSLGDDQARRLGAILAGAYFKPAVAARVEAVIGGLLIDWVTVRPTSPAVGRSIADLEIRRRTRMTVAAIVRGDESLVAPEPTEVIAAGDRLVVVGRPEDLSGFVERVIGT